MLICLIPTKMGILMTPAARTRIFEKLSAVFVLASHICSLSQQLPHCSHFFKGISTQNKSVKMQVFPQLNKGWTCSKCILYINVYIGEIYHLKTIYGPTKNQINLKSLDLRLI